MFMTQPVPLALSPVETMSCRDVRARPSAHCTILERASISGPDRPQRLPDGPKRRRTCALSVHTITQVTVPQYVTASRPCWSGRRPAERLVENPYTPPPLGPHPRG